MMSSRSQIISKAFFTLSVVVFMGHSAVGLARGWKFASPFIATDFVLPLFFYFLAHALRALRLGVLLGAGRARKLLALYVYSAACSSIIPFKLGELVRVNEIAWWANSYWKGLLIVWIERVFDVVVIGAMAMFFLSTGMQEPKEISILVWIIGGFVFLTLLFFFIVPEQLCSLNLHVMRNYKGRKAILILSILDSLYQLFEQVRPLLSGKLVTLCLLTLFVWGAELLALYTLFDVASWTAAVKSLVRQFTAVLSEGMAAGGAAGDALTRFEEVKMLALIACGLLALIFHCRYRFRAESRCD